MTETKFTPGPWFFGKMHGWSGISITRRPTDDYGPRGTIGDAPLAQVVEKAAHWENSYPVNANAALIAAAPTLYEALSKSDELIVDAQEILAEYLPPDGRPAEDIVHMLLGLLDGPEQREVQNATRAALSKARGQT